MKLAKSVTVTKNHTVTITAVDIRRKFKLPEGCEIRMSVNEASVSPDGDNDLMLELTAEWTTTTDRGGQ